MHIMKLRDVNVEDLRLSVIFPEKCFSLYQGFWAKCPKIYGNFIYIKFWPQEN